MLAFTDLLRADGPNVGGLLSFFVQPEEEDIAFLAGRNAAARAKGGKEINVGRPGANIAMQAEGAHNGIHPDLIGLAALLLVGPFTAKSLTLDVPVSEHFAAVVKASLRRAVGPVDPAIAPRALPDRGREALAFSGGVDSCAALALLPEDAVSFFMNRVPLRGRKAGMYKADAALQTCADVRKSGRDVRVIDTTMEYIRDPVGFSVDWTNSLGAVLHADAFGLRSINFGMIAESAFATGHEDFSELSTRSVNKAWAPLFEAVGLPISLPTSGLSEVLTTKIAASHSKEWRAQSCVRGTADEPCRKCFKCFRKTILDGRVADRAIDAAHFDIAKSSKEVQGRLLALPIHHENVLAYSIQGLKVNGSSPIYDALQEKTAVIAEYAKGLDFMNRIYPGYKAYVPQHLRADVADRLARYVQPMTEDDIQIVENWNIHFLAKDERYLKAQERLKAALS